MRTSYFGLTHLAHEENQSPTFPPILATILQILMIKNGSTLRGYKANICKDQEHILGQQGQHTDVNLQKWAIITLITKEYSSLPNSALKCCPSPHLAPPVETKTKRTDATSARPSPHRKQNKKVRRDK